MRTGNICAFDRKRVHRVLEEYAAGNSLYAEHYEFGLLRANPSMTGATPLDRQNYILDHCHPARQNGYCCSTSVIALF